MKPKTYQRSDIQQHDNERSYTEWIQAAGYSQATDPYHRITCNRAGVVYAGILQLPGMRTKGVC